MEELGVFVTFKHIFYFGSSLPEDSSFLDGEVEGVRSKRTEAVFQSREGTLLLNEVEDSDKDTTVFLSLKGVDCTLVPVLTGGAAKAKATN
jgi:hypothetical protein